MSKARDNASKTIDTIQLDDSKFFEGIISETISTDYILFEDGGKILSENYTTLNAVYVLSTQTLTTNTTISSGITVINDGPVTLSSGVTLTVLGNINIE